MWAPADNLLNDKIIDASRNAVHYIISLFFMYVKHKQASIIKSRT